MNCAKKLLGFHIKYVRILCYNLFDDNVKTFLEFLFYGKNIKPFFFPILKLNKQNIT